MIEAIQRFISELRTAGVRVSPAEAIDAARAVQAVGPENRGLFRIALRSTLSKTHEDAVVLDRVFDKFFAAPGPESFKRNQGGGATPSSSSGSRPGRREARDEEEPPGARSGRREGERERRERPGRLRILTAHRLVPPSEGRSALRDRRHTRMPAARGRPQPRPPRRASSRESSPATVPLDPRRIDLAGPLARVEEECVAREVPRLIREIRTRAGRRYRRGGADRLWAARLMRDNIGTGGVPFIIPFRRRRKRRPRVIVLADVSWSVMRASSLFLIMTREFLKGGARASIYFFVDRCLEATDAVARWPGPGKVAFGRLLDGIAGLDPRAASDYGRAFYQAIHAPRGALRAGGRDTVLIVLGDARSNFRDPQSWVFGELASRCRRVIWLNPEPVVRWNTGDSRLDEYLPHCDVVCEANDLRGIARGVAEIVRSL